jgi:hypothetical protein
MTTRVMVIVIALAASRVEAQELEPRSYSPSPVGTTFVIGGVGRSEGPIVMDPSLDVDNVKGDLWIATPGVGYVFDLAGRQARVLAVAPVAWGVVTGDLHAAPQRQDLTGLADPRVKLSVGLRNAPAVKPSEFARATRDGIVIGTSVTIVPPLGQYQSTQLVNLGYNRWALKPEAGVSHQIGRWIIDGYAGVWWFTENHAYYPGHSHKRQSPVGAWQGHVSYALPRRSWVAFDGTWFTGGQSRVDESLNSDLQRNSRLGATLSVPTSKMQSLKFVYSAGAVTRRGSAFHTLNVTWQIVRLAK